MKAGIKFGRKPKLSDSSAGKPSNAVPLARRWPKSYAVDISIISRLRVGTALVQQVADKAAK